MASYKGANISDWAILAILAGAGYLAWKLVGQPIANIATGIDNAVNPWLTDIGAIGNLPKDIAGAVTGKNADGSLNSIGLANAEANQKTTFSPSEVANAQALLTANAATPSDIASFASLPVLNFSDPSSVSSYLTAQNNAPQQSSQALGNYIQANPTYNPNSSITQNTSGYSSINPLVKLAAPD
jgi:hypothetical protein